MTELVHEAQVLIFHDRMWVQCNEDCSWSLRFEDTPVPLEEIDRVFAQHLKKVAFDEAFE